MDRRKVGAWTHSLSAILNEKSKSDRSVSIKHDLIQSHQVVLWEQRRERLTARLCRDDINLMSAGAMAPDRPLR
jgi:hypothetical protein